jgi:transcriptional regulator with XRE-family HTH domain
VSGRLTFSQELSNALAEARVRRGLDQQRLADAIAREQHRRRPAGPERDELIRRAARSWASRISQWKNGRRLPASPRELLLAMKVIAPGTSPDVWIDRWKEARDHDRRDALSQPAEPHPPAEIDIAPTPRTPAERAQEERAVPPTAAGSLRRFLRVPQAVAVAGLVVAMVGVAAIIGPGNDWVNIGGRDDAETTRPGASDVYDLVVAPAPPAERWITAGLGCEPRKEWNYRFPGTYRGDVYVQLAASLRKRASAKVTLIWGGKQWQDVIEVHPGAVHRGMGGTLLGFGKTGSTDQEPPDTNPPVVFRSSLAVCAVFGTARTRPPPAPLLYLRTPGWTQLGS